MEGHVVEGCECEEDARVACNMLDGAPPVSAVLTDKIWVEEKDVFSFVCLGAFMS